MKKEIILITCILLAGCTINRPLMISTTSVGPNEKPIGIVYEHVHQYHALGFIHWGDDSLERAFNEAVESIKADTLVNVFVDKECWFPLIPIYLDCNLNLIGTAVRYENKDGKRLQRYDIDFRDSNIPTFGTCNNDDNCAYGSRCVKEQPEARGLCEKVGGAPGAEAGRSDCPPGEVKRYGQCYPTNPILGEPGK